MSRTLVALVLALLVAPAWIAAQEPTPAKAPASAKPVALSEADQLKATVIRLQVALLEQQRESAKLTADVARLKTELADAQFQSLNQTANALAADFVTKLGGQAGDTFDWQTLGLRARPADPKPEP